MTTSPTSFPVSGTRTPIQLVPLHEVEIALVGNFFTQIASAIGTGLIVSPGIIQVNAHKIPRFLVGLTFMGVGVILYYWFVYRKWSDWKARQTPVPSRFIGADYQGDSPTPSFSPQITHPT